MAGKRLEHLSDKSLSFYLDKYQFVPPQLDQHPHEDLNLVVVIPCFNEPDLIRSLNALYNCARPKSAVEIITVINSGEHHPDKIKRDNLFALKEAEHWAEHYSSPEFNYHFLHFPDLPEKHAGVGLARKIGMDEAVNRLEWVDKNGIIACFDADASCDENYLTELENHFEKYNRSPGCSVHFEHPLAGAEYDPEVYEAICKYELHLRYYKEALSWCGFPFAFHTVGSSMAVTSLAYQMQGGMNRRKAGEDFYFLNKIIGLGGFTELNTTRIIPSPRVSDRVPFGTGKAVGEYIETETGVQLTYNVSCFSALKNFVNLVPDLFNTTLDERFFSGLDPILLNFLKNDDYLSKLTEIQENTKEVETFIKRVFQWFDAFKVLKAIHYMRDHTSHNMPVEDAASDLLNLLGTVHEKKAANELLSIYRKRQVEGSKMEINKSLI